MCDRDEIVGQVADPIPSIRVEPAAVGEPTWARDDDREPFDERAEIEKIRPGELQVGQQESGTRFTMDVVAQLQPVADERRHRGGSLVIHRMHRVLWKC